MRVATARGTKVLVLTEVVPVDDVVVVVELVDVPFGPVAVVDEPPVLPVEVFVVVVLEEPFGPVLLVTEPPVDVPPEPVLLVEEPPVVPVELLVVDVVEEPLGPLLVVEELLVLPFDVLVVEVPADEELLEDVVVGGVLVGNDHA